MAGPIPAHWQLQEAKQRFSEVIRAVEREGPQIITRHGEDVAVIIDIAEWHKLTTPAADLKEASLVPRLSMTTASRSSTRLRRSASRTLAAASTSRSNCDLLAGHQRHFRGPQAQPGAERDRLACRIHRPATFTSAC